MAVLHFAVKLKSLEAFLQSMAAGIVVFGRNVPDRKFDLHAFHAIRDNRRLPASPVTFMNPVESAYPCCLANPEHAYTEGILAGVTGAGTPQDLEAKLRQWLCSVAQGIEKDYCEARQNGRTWARGNGIEYDFPVLHEQIAVTDLQGDALVWRPAIEVVEFCPEEDLFSRYVLHATRLILKTEKARVKNFENQQRMLAENAIAALCDWDHIKYL
jgi:hypothetical protein